MKKSKTKFLALVSVVLILFLTACRNPFLAGLPEQSTTTNSTSNPTSTNTNTTVNVTSVSLDKSQLTLYIGDSCKLIATVSPTNATNKNLSWTSENTSIATVSSLGVIKGIAKGTTTIKATSNNGKIASCVVIVEDTKVTVSFDQCLTTNDDTDVLSYTIDRNTNLEVPSDPTKTEHVFSGWYENASYTGESLSYTSINNKNYIIASENITYYAKWIEESLFVPVTSISLSSSTLSIKQYCTEDFTITVNPTDASNKAFTISFNNNYATYADGKITANTVGSSTMTVTSNSNNTVSSSCEITITQPPLGDVHPNVGSFSPVDTNGDDEGLGWSTLTSTYGANENGSDVDFAVYSANATKILLEIYESASGQNAKYDYWMEKGSDNIWRARLSSVPEYSLYAFRAWGANWTYSDSWTRNNSSEGYVSDVNTDGCRFNPNKVLYDPYARELTHDTNSPNVSVGSDTLKDDNGIFGTGAESVTFAGVTSERRNFDTGKYVPKSVYIKDSIYSGTAKPTFSKGKDIIYEAHPRGLTKHSSSAKLTTILDGFDGFSNIVDIPSDEQGTYAGAAKMAPYLKGLGITVIELLPVQETANDGNPDDGPGGNFWGYMTFGYFSPDRRYSKDKSLGGPTREFKEMVSAFHDAGIKVYLDVVYNHTGEGGPWYSTDSRATVTSVCFTGLDAPSWYCLTPSDKSDYWQTTGCGNNLRCDNAMVRKFITDSLTYWVDSMGVDGFRFDLATVLGRELNGSSWNYNSSATTLTTIASLASSKNFRVIAESWDCGDNSYQVGNFPANWGGWNGRYRDSIRIYLNAGNLSGAISYTDAFYGDYSNFSETSGNESINFIDAHDGFTLADLASYAGEGNSLNSTLTWPFGPSDGGNSDSNTIEGTEPAMVRQRHRNYFTWLMFSRGAPMIVYGDEFGRTQNGNNNPYNIDSVATWNNYNMISSVSPHTISTGGDGSYTNKFGTFDNTSNANFKFAKFLMNLRKNDDALTSSDYSTTIEYTKNDNSSSFSSTSDRCVNIYYKGAASGGSDYYIMSNMWTEQVSHTIPDAGTGYKWVRIVDTASWAEEYNNYWTLSNAETITSTYGVNAWSIVILQKVSTTLTTCATPVISPGSKTFTDESVSVSITCSTSGASIYYTTNGDTPTSSSTEYTGSFLVGSELSNDETITIKAIAILSGRTDSSVRQATYTKSSVDLSKSGVMLQGFNWASASRTDSSRWGEWYNIMNAQASTIKDTFAYVWFPPPSKTDTNSSEGYGPTELNDLNNCYGTATELTSLIQAISPAKAIADIVVNHRAGSTSWGDFTNPSWNVEKGVNYKAICSDDEGFTDEPAYMGAVPTNMRGAADTGATYSAYRDLDHTNTDVQNGIITWMNDVLKSAGFVGWRYDYVKGFSGNYVGQYNESSSAEFSVGEYWPTDGFSSSNPSAWGDEIKAWITATDDGGQRSRAFDFALKGIMNTVFGSNSSNVSNGQYNLLSNAASLMMSQSSDAVTFIDNHDTGSTQGHWYLDPVDIGTAYAFILTHPGYPCVAWQHYFTDAQSGNHSESQYIGGSTVPGTSKTYKDHIDYLINLRKTCGISYDSTITNLVSSSSGYAALIDGSEKDVIVSIGASYTPTQENFSGNNPVYSGTNFQIYVEGESGDTPTVTRYKLSLIEDVGSGNAVYFTGSFDEGSNWATAVRGIWDSSINGWYTTVTGSSFEWKTMTGNYDLGESVTTNTSGLEWASGANKTQADGTLIQ